MKTLLTIIMMVSVSGYGQRGFSRRGGNTQPSHSPVASAETKLDKISSTPAMEENSDYASTVEWAAENIIYTDSRGSRWYAQNAFIADDDGELHGLTFKKGDIVFRVASVPKEVWHKADFKKYPRPVLDSDKPEFKELPIKIKHFINVYAKERPNMKFDLRIYKVAQQRALQGGPHPADINQRIWNGGFRTPESKRMNTSESLWVGHTAEQVLAGWRGHVPHRVHVFGERWPYDQHQFYGVGYNPANGQWAILTAPPEIP